MLYFNATVTHSNYGSVAITHSNYLYMKNSSVEPFVIAGELHKTKMTVDIDLRIFRKSVTKMAFGDTSNTRLLTSL